MSIWPNCATRSDIVCVILLSPFTSMVLRARGEIGVRVSLVERGKQETHGRKCRHAEQDRETGEAQVIQHVNCLNAFPQGSLMTHGTPSSTKEIRKRAALFRTPP